MGRVGGGASLNISITSSQFYLTNFRDHCHLTLNKNNGIFYAFCWSGTIFYDGNFYLPAFLESVCLLYVDVSY